GVAPADNRAAYQVLYSCCPSRGSEVSAAEIKKPACAGFVLRGATFIRAWMNVPRKIVGSGHFALNHYRDVGNDIRKQDDLNGVFAHCLQVAIRQANLRFLDGIEAITYQRSGNVHAGNGTEQTTIDTRFLRNSNGVAS